MSALRHRRAPVVLAAVSGIILHFAFPHWNVELCEWVWMLPLLAVLWLSESKPPAVDPATGWFRRRWRLSAPVRKPLFLGWVAGLCFFVPTLSWLRHSSRVIAGAVDNRWIGWGPELMGWVAVAAMCVWLSLYFGVWSAFVANMARPRKAVLLHGSWLAVSIESLRCAALAAAFWVVMEWQRGIIFTGFGWNGLGVALYHNLVLVQIADLVGMAGTSFLPVFVSCVVFNTVHRLTLYWQAGKRFRLCLDTSVAVLLLALTAVYGIKKMGVKPDGTVPVKVACVQLNDPQAVRWGGEHIGENYQRYADLTRLYGEARQGAATSPVDLVIWPESAMALPFDHPDHPQYFNDLLALGDFSLLAGCDYRDPAGRPSYTSAALFNKSWANVQLYHKVHLVPFGEYLPLRHSVPLMNTLLGGVLPGDFDFGPSTEPLKLVKPQVQIIPLICFEDTVGELARQFVRDAPQFLANLTNDGWFLDSDEMEQQKATAIFRCIELRRPMVRATNTGVTCFVDERGVELKRLADPETGSTLIEGVLPGTIEVPSHPVMTFYALHGDVFAWVCFGVCLLAAGLNWRNRHRA